ncbi:MAG: molecular chaperone HscC [Acidobacteriota bacterium]|jgi:molecular chaperone DnaK|nr:molecular chaperone HscC [Acidobacteriota bacterium]
MSNYIDFGIDLGTTNSCIARAAGGEVMVIQNNDQMNVTPSVVRVLKSGSLLVGRRAYNALAEDTDNVAQEVKRLMGQRYAKTFPASGRVMSPEEIAAEVLKSLLADARRRTGEEARAACVTVPAAFTALQCEATARAAQLAGLEEYPLLQEPIAAAVAYGAAPGVRDQRWLVFDLGGGTLDVAVVSTRDGRLNVLEHRGDNHLGGKDIDRALVENVLVPFLAEQFALPRAEREAAELSRLLRKLTLLAEYAKIELTTADETIVSLLDLGEDREGRLIEAELPLKRARLESELEPLVARCLRLADEALAGARVRGLELDRVLLVGGPTQMPRVREALAAHLGAPVDSTLDPMTAVARGAAVYASTVERNAPSVGVKEETKTDALTVRLAYDPLTAEPRSRVAGKLTGKGSDAALEVKIDAEGGLWTSGWTPARECFFEMALVLQEGRLNRFTLSVRDAKGRALEVSPNEFQIRHGLALDAPPLPHTISVEVAHADGREELSPVFQRRTLLPAERTVTYRAAHTLRPSEPDTSLAVKLWEGEALTDPQANNWVGNFHVRSEAIRRPVPEGAEVQLHIKVDASRLITVDVFIPYLNEHFTDRVFIPKEEEPDYIELLKGAHLEIENCLARLERVEEQLMLTGARAEDFDFPEVVYDDGYKPDAEDIYKWGDAPAADPRRAEVERLRRELEDFDIELGAHQSTGDAEDQDRAARVVEHLREARARVAELERRAGIAHAGSGVSDANSLADSAAETVSAHGTDAQRERLAALRRELSEALARGDVRGVKKAATALRALRTQVLHAQDWFWEDWFEYLARPGRQFLNAEEAARWVAQGHEALQAGDRKQLERAVSWLWSLQPPDEQSARRERAVKPGLKQ